MVINKAGGIKCNCTLFMRKQATKTMMLFLDIWNIYNTTISKNCCKAANLNSLFGLKMTKQFKLLEKQYKKEKSRSKKSITCG